MKGIGAYKAAKKQASPEQLVLLLYREALTRLEALAVGDHDHAVWVKHTHHVRSILLELLEALDFEASADLSGQLQRLYTWCMAELVAIARDRDAARVAGVARVIQSLHDGWEAVIARPEPGIAWAS